MPEVFGHGMEISGTLQQKLMGASAHSVEKKSLFRDFSHWNSQIPNYSLFFTIFGNLLACTKEWSWKYFSWVLTSAVCEGRCCWLPFVQTKHRKTWIKCVFFLWLALWVWNFTFELWFLCIAVDLTMEKWDQCWRDLIPTFPRLFCEGRTGRGINFLWALSNKIPSSHRFSVQTKQRANTLGNLGKGAAPLWIRGCPRHRPSLRVQPMISEPALR